MVEEQSAQDAIAGLSPVSWASTVSHVGRIVPDLEAAMRQWTSVHGFSWARVRRTPTRLLIDGREVDVVTAVTLSLEGPVHVELIEEIPGTVFERARGGPIHHIAYWVPDLLAEAERLVAAGFEVEATLPGPEIVNTFCYLRGPDGMRLEPKPEASRPALERRLPDPESPSRASG